MRSLRHGAGNHRQAGAVVALPAAREESDRPQNAHDAGPGESDFGDYNRLPSSPENALASPSAPRPTQAARWASAFRYQLLGSPPGSLVWESLGLETGKNVLVSVLHHSAQSRAPNGL